MHHELEDLTAELPTFLGTRVVEHVHSSIRAGNVVLMSLPKSLWRVLIQSASQQLYGRDDFVYTQGEQSLRLFIVKQGRVGIEHASGKLLTEINEAGYFGELESFAEQSNPVHRGRRQSRHQYHATTLTYCEIYAINLDIVIATIGNGNFEEARYLFGAVAQVRSEHYSSGIFHSDLEAVAQGLERYVSEAKRRKHMTDKEVKLRSAGSNRRFVVRNARRRRSSVGPACEMPSCSTDVARAARSLVSEGDGGSNTDTELAGDERHTAKLWKHQELRRRRTLSTRGQQTFSKAAALLPVLGGGKSDDASARDHQQQQRLSRLEVEVQTLCQLVESREDAADEQATRTHELLMGILARSGGKGQGQEEAGEVK